MLMAVDTQERGRVRLEQQAMKWVAVSLINVKAGGTRKGSVR